MNEELVATIVPLLYQCKDVELLEIIRQLLQKSR